MAKAGSVAEHILLHHDNSQKSNTQPLCRGLETRRVRVRVCHKAFSRTRRDTEAATGSGM